MMPEQLEIFDAGPRTPIPAQPSTFSKRRPCTPAPIGSGPEGQTCGPCKHLYRHRMAKTYLKCDLMRRHWTGGAGTDIKARWPACRQWQQQTTED